MRVLLLIPALALGCATRPPPEVASFTALPGFQPYEEVVEQLGRKIAVMDEGSGLLTSGERFYYIAYLTREALDDPGPGSDAFPLGAEMRALWSQRRRMLDATRVNVVFLEARVFPGTPGSRTRRSVYVAKDGHWGEDPVASFVIEEWTGPDQ